MERSLHVIDKGPDAPLIGVCTECNRRFIVGHTPGEESMHLLTRGFDDHNCNDDTDPGPAAQMVREAIDQRY